VCFFCYYWLNKGIGKEQFHHVDDPGTLSSSQTNKQTNKQTTTKEKFRKLTNTFAFECDGWLGYRIYFIPLQRIVKEFKDLKKAHNADKDIRLQPNENDLYKWSGTIVGPRDTPYEGGEFHVDIAIPENYPLTPPKVTMLTKCFHPNIHFKTGEICLDILKTAWTPAWTIQAVCRAIIALLSNPEADSPLNCDAGNLIRNNDTRGFKSMATMYTKIYARPTLSSS